MKWFSAEEINEVIRYNEFVPYLKSFYQKESFCPPRPHYPITNTSSGDGTFLLMPSWQTDKYIGLKIITVFPENKTSPSIQGMYILFDACNGNILAQFDGLALTIKRTAAVSALASSILSNPSSRQLLFFGTGNLCLEMIKAHCSQRPIRQVFIHGRNFSKAQEKANSLQIEGVSITPIESYEHYIDQSDIISCATLSPDPLFDGKLVRQNTYIDLVGSYKPNMREVDDALISRCNIFVDTPQAIHESGDLKIPLDQNIITPSDIKSDLIQLCNGMLPILSDFVLFKSVGMATSDLAAASFIYEHHLANTNIDA